MAGKNGAAASYLIFRVEESKVYLQKMLTFHLNRYYNERLTENNRRNPHENLYG